MTPPATTGAFGERAALPIAAVVRWLAHATVITAMWMVVGCAVAFGAMLTLPSALGYRELTVRTGSMTPTIGVGALVLDEPIQPTEARPGDVITFPEPGTHGQLLTHRVRSLSVRGDRAYVVTKGDANHTVERWNVPLHETLGRVIYRLPKAGYVHAWVSGRGGWLALVAILLLWAGSALRAIWASPQRSEPEERAAGG